MHSHQGIVAISKITKEIFYINGWLLRQDGMNEGQSTGLTSVKMMNKSQWLSRLSHT